MIMIVILEWPIHEMGTARMGDPKTSVLNKWNQMHEVSNVLLLMVLACLP
jgi:choline dehydrogenase-like flavoprotein